MKLLEVWYSRINRKCYSLKGLPKWVLPELQYLIKRIEALEAELKELKNACR